MKNEMLSKGVKIVKAEAKDLIGGDYSLLNKNNELNLFKFYGNLDYSLGLIKLYELVGEDKLYKEIDGKLYSDVIINVGFKYKGEEHTKAEEESLTKFYEEKNKVYEKYDIKINATNNYINNYLKCNKEITELKKYIKESEEGLVKNAYENRLESLIKITKNNLKFKLIKELKEQRAAEVNKLEEKVLRGSLALRAELYKNGFKVDGKHYVRFLRSAGSAKAGNCLFIQEQYYKPMLEWLLAGLDIKEEQVLNDKLPQIEAYMALAFSSLTDTIEIPKESILLVDDVNSVFSDIASVTSLVNGELVTEDKEVVIKNSLFDGSSIIDMDFIPMKYRIAGGGQARNRFFKGYFFGGNIQQFFKDNGITEVGQLNGKTLATKIEDIKLITTKSSIKYMKFGSFEQWLENIDTTFGIGLVAHASKFLGGEYIQTHYQLINNLQLNKQETEELAKDTVEYIKNLKNCLPMFLKHAGQIGEIEEDEKLEVKINKYTAREDFFINLAKVNKNFANTRVFKNYRKQMIKNFVDNAKHGRLLIKGCYAVVIANSYEYLLHSIGKLVNKDGSLNANMEVGEMMCDFFEYNRGYVCSRSPMPVQGNILLSTNKDNQNIRKYFSYVDENGNSVMPKFIMHRNIINENCCEKASGFDEDGDKFAIFDNKMLLKKAKQNYDVFLTPVNCVESKETIEYKNNAESKAIMDYKTSKNNIGRIINDSMILVSEYWHRLNNGATHEQLKDLYNVISKLSIMSNICIDSSKKLCPYDEERILKEIEKCRYFRPKEITMLKLTKENITEEENKLLKELKAKKVKTDEDKQEIYKLTHKEKEVKVRPYFFSVVGEGQNYKFEKFDCAMDYLVEILETKVRGKRGSKDVKLKDLLINNGKGIKTGNKKTEHYNKLIEIAEELVEFKNAIWDIDNETYNTLTTSEKHEKYKEVVEKAVEKVKEIGTKRNGKGINRETMVAFFNGIDKEKKEFTKKESLILMLMYKNNPITFLNLFKIDAIEVLVETTEDKADVKEYGKGYKLVEKKLKVK